MSIRFTYEPLPHCADDEPIVVILRPNPDRIRFTCAVCGCVCQPEPVFAYASSDRLCGAVCEFCLGWGPDAWPELLTERATRLEALAGDLRMAARRPWLGAPSHEEWRAAVEAAATGEER